MKVTVREGFGSMCIPSNFDSVIDETNLTISNRRICFELTTKPEKNYIYYETYERSQNALFLMLNNSI